MRISDWSSDVCSSDLVRPRTRLRPSGTAGWPEFATWSSPGARAASLAAPGRRPLVRIRTGVGQHGTRQPGRFDPPAATGENADCPPVHIQLMTLPGQPPSTPQPDAASLRLSVDPLMDWTDTHSPTFPRRWAPQANEIES